MESYFSAAIFYLISYVYPVKWGITEWHITYIKGFAMEQLLFFICFSNLLTFISPLGVHGAFKNLFIGSTFQTGIDASILIHKNRSSTAL